MTETQANRAPAERHEQPPTGRGPEPTQDKHESRPDGQDTSSPHSRLLDHALATYSEDSKVAKPIQQAAVGSDGFAIVGVAADKEKGNPESVKKDQPTQPKDLQSALDGLKFINYGNGQTYAGTIIKANVRPEIYEVKPGETLEQIARKHLGASATPENVKKHMSEISIANTVVGEKGNEYVGKKGDVIRLPGHTADGAVVLKDTRGTRYTLTEDGKTRVSYLDGTGFERTPNPDGSSTKKYFGAKPEDNYTVKIGKDGEVLSNDRVDPAHKPAADLATETKKLEDLADKNMGIKRERDEFKRDMQKLVERARKSGLPESEVAQTFAEVSRILEAKGANQPMTSRERSRLASGIMRGAAYPTSNDQGGHDSCSMAMVENRFYQREPSTVARTIADVATTGKFVAADGTVVRMDPQDLRAHGEGALNESRGTNVRTYASQMFQVTAANAYHTSHNERTFPPGETRYSQVKPRDDRDTGERLVDSSNAKTNEPVLGPGNAASPDGVVETSYLLNGKHESNVLVIGREVAAASPDNPKANVVNSPDELIARLKEAKADGKPMAVGIMVHANADPFYKQRSKEGDPLKGKDPKVEDVLVDLHYVNVVGFDEKTGMVKVDNQWGDEHDMIDKPISVYELFNATNRPTGNTWLSRLDDGWDKNSQEQNRDLLKTVMRANIVKWAADGESKDKPDNQQDMNLSWKKYDMLLNKLSPSNQAVVRKVVEDTLKEWDDELMKKAKGK